MRCGVERTISLLLLFAGFPTCSLAQNQEVFADTVVLHGKIYTVNLIQPWAEALAIRKGTVIAIGSEKAIEAYRGPLTKVIDAREHVVLPGFTDTHVHFMSASLRLTQVQLDDATNVVELQRRVKEYADAHPKAPWILGSGWLYSAFGSAAVPDRKFLDEVVPDRPVFLTAYDHHTAWVNSKALEVAGITHDTPDPPNGRITRDPKTGAATGMLQEAPAQQLIDQHIPKPTARERLEALRRGMHEANRFGVVRVHTMIGDSTFLGLYNELRKHGELSVRFYVCNYIPPPELTETEIAQAEEDRRNYHDEWIDAGCIKFMADGVIEARTAAMLEPYSDNSGTSGHLNWDTGKFNQGVSELDRRGFQICTHAIGDRAIRQALDAYQEAAKVNGMVDTRHRVEHIEDPSAADIPRFGELGVIASMQPLHALPNDNNLHVWARNVGPERAKRSWPWHSIIENGGRVGFGSDWSVVTINPWPGIQLLLTRQTADGKPPEGWNPEQRLTLERAIEGYTLDGAYAGRREMTEGSLEPGKLADLVIVSQDPLHTPVPKIGKTEVLLTMVGGTVVYQSPSSSAAISVSQ